MRSTEVASDEAAADDRTTKARIRDAAIACFGEHGISGTTARKVGSAAGVSAGLVMHHFGSMEGLRVACDQQVTDLIRQLKSEAMAAGAGLDPLAALRSTEDGPPLARYLARTLVDGSPHVADLVDEIVADAIEYSETGVETGVLTPTRYPRERAAIMTMWSLGALVLHEHLERLIGIDLTDPASNSQAAASYMAPALELLSGLFTETTVERMEEAFNDATKAEEGTP